MAARTSMADLLLTLRGLTNAGSAEYAVNGSAYWVDQQLQDVLDRHVQPIRHELLDVLPTHGSGGSITYVNYQSPHRFFESVLAGTPTTRFVIQDEAGDAIGSAGFSVDYPRGLVTFGTATGGLSRYLTGYSYDMNAAAADVWQQKAAHYVTAYDFSSDNHNLRRSQIIDNCLKMAREYASGAAIYSVSMERSDTEE